MPVWPFGRKARRAKESNIESENLVSEAEKTQGLRTEPSSTTARRPGQGIGRKLSKRRDGPRRNSSKRQTAWERPGDEDLLQMPIPGKSIEDLTALPGQTGLRTSPHLRPVTTHGNADIPYDFHGHGASHASLPSARDRGKLQRPPSRQKRQTFDTVPRRKSSKRKNDPVREEEIRAMSAQLPLGKRPANHRYVYTRSSVYERCVPFSMASRRMLDYLRNVPINLLVPSHVFQRSTIWQD